VNPEDFKFYDPPLTKK